jgi:putative effector of murein hydrolase
MSPMFHNVWIPLSRSPAFGIALTLIGYQLGCRLQRCLRGNPLCNPVLIAIGSIIAVLLLTGTDYRTYFETASWIHFLLGPATVALAIPLYKNIGEIRRAALAIGAAVGAGAFAASGSAMAIAWSLGASPTVIRSIAAVLVVVTGVFGSLCAPEIAAVLGVRCWRARGLAAGVAGHGIATARMLCLNETAGAFSGLAMGLCGLLTAVCLPVIFHFLHLDAG